MIIPGVHPPGTGHWHVPDTALCSALAEVFTWATDEATAVAAVSGGWPLADVIAAPRLDTEFCSAVVCDGNADLASLAKLLALVWTLLSAVCRELSPRQPPAASYHPAIPQVPEVPGCLPLCGRAAQAWQARGPASSLPAGGCALLGAGLPSMRALAKASARR